VKANVLEARELADPFPLTLDILPVAVESTREDPRAVELPRQHSEDVGSFHGEVDDVRSA